MMAEAANPIFNRKASGGIAERKEKWEMKRERLSPNYTTCLADVICVKAG